GRNSLGVEVCERTIVGDELALTLDDVDVDAGLVVYAAREHLAPARRDRRVAHDDLRYDAAHRLDAERERRDVEQQHLAAAADENVGLHGGAERHDFVGIQLAVRRPAEQLFDHAAHERDAGGSANEHRFVDILRLEAGVGQRLPAQLESPVYERPDDALEVRARDALAIAGGHGGGRLDADLGLVHV